MKFSFNSLKAISTIILLISCSDNKGVSQVSSQSETGSMDNQLERMKYDYHAWIATQEQHDLVVEFDPTAEAIDVKDPRFSWIVPLEGRGRKQMAYQIQVVTTLDLLHSGQPDMWDSGVVLSGQSIQVTYLGHPLQSNSEYFWRVRVRDESGNFHPYSRPARFRTALLKTTDWEAHWIGRGLPNEIVVDVQLLYDFPTSSRIPKEAKRIEPDLRSPLFRKEFMIDRPVRSARLFVSGMGVYEARLNGGRVGNRLLAPAKTDYRKRILYDTYDVSRELKPGKNALGVMLGNGWFNPPKRWWGWQMQWYGSPRLILQLEISYIDGSSSRIITDETWKSTLGPITFNCIYDGEDYDARLEQAGWDQPGFNDEQWNGANVVQSPGGIFASATVQPMIATETIRPLTVNEPKPGVYVFDMGRNFTGWVRLKAQGSRGAVVKLRFAEAVELDGILDRRTMGEARAEDNYILNGHGSEVYEPHFTYRGFQYVEVTGYPGVPSLNDLEGQFIHTGTHPAGFFECGNDLINRIHLCTVQTQRCNIQMGVPTDDTQRAERLGWGADGWISAQEAMFNLDMPRLYAKWMRDFYDQQTLSGLVGMIAPSPGLEEDLIWSAAYVMIPWWQYLEYGDLRILEEHYSSLIRYMDYLATRGQADIEPLLHSIEGTDPIWEKPDEKPPLPGYLQRSQWGDHLSLSEGFKGRSGLPLSITTAFYYQDACTMVNIAKVLGKNEDARRFARIAEEIRCAFNDKFFNVEKNSYDDGSQASQAIALSLGLVPGDHKNAVLQTLLDDMFGKHGGHLTTGYPGTKSLIDALTEAGKPDVVWHLATLTGFPSWSDMLHARTTSVEGWKGGSLNHVALVAPLDAWFYTTLAGIRIDEANPAYANIVIKPYVPKDLDWVTAWVNTIHGRVESFWRVRDNILTLEVTIPANSCALVHVPSKNVRDVHESGHPAAKANGVTFSGTYSGNSIFRIGSGHYIFTCPLLR